MAANEWGQNEFGTDVTLIEERLRLTPTERWRRHAEALAFVEGLREAARAKRLPTTTPTLGRRGRKTTG